MAALVPLTGAQALDPVVYTIRFPDPASRSFVVDVAMPAPKAESVDLMMPVWSPGFYNLQNYADRVSAFTAKGADGAGLAVSKSAPNRWTVTTGGQTSFTASYTVAAPRGSNLSNGVTDTSAVIIGPATYVALVEPARRPAEVRLELPASWTGSMTSLDAAPGGKPNHYVAPDYDVLTDSPILAGADLTSTPFTAGGIQHYWTYLGKAEWTGERVAAAITPLIEEHIRFWGGLPYKKYVFLNIVTGGGGGSGVANSVAIDRRT
jgi:predicted metalloprotease with PDZ domain